MSTYSIYFHGKIRKVLPNTPSYRKLCNNNLVMKWPSQYQGHFYGDPYQCKIKWAVSC